MKIRKNCLPRRLFDWLCFLLINSVMPTIFVFEMVIVLPEFHEPAGFWHTFTMILGLFFIFQIEGNYVACLMVDTSVDYTNLRPPRKDKKQLETLGWHQCEKCEKLAPPRSWHCSVCKTCILKRDHHCLFTGSCVGHYNQRYFMLFIVYLFIGSIYAFVYNSIFLWVLNGHIYNNVLSFIKIICPMLLLISGNKWYNLFLILYNFNILALVYSIILLVFHGSGLVKGEVCYEKDKNFSFNNGSLKRNFETVFGKRLYLVWLSPLIKSKLPDDGVNWKLSLAEMTENETKLR